MSETNFYGYKILGIIRHLDGKEYMATQDEEN